MLQRVSEIGDEFSAPTFFLASVPAFLIFVLLFDETQSVQLLLLEKNRGLVKGSGGLHWDMLLIGGTFWRQQAQTVAVCSCHFGPGHHALAVDVRRRRALAWTCRIACGHEAATAGRADGKLLVVRALAITITP